MRRLSGSLCAVLLGLTLVGCSSGNNAETSGSVVTGALRQLISNRGEDAAPPKITATRAELEAAGLGAQPLLVVRMPASTLIPVRVRSMPAASRFKRSVLALRPAASNRCEPV